MKDFWACKHDWHQLQSFMDQRTVTEQREIYRHHTYTVLPPVWNSGTMPPIVHLFSLLRMRNKVRLLNITGLEIVHCLHLPHQHGFIVLPHRDAKPLTA